MKHFSKHIRKCLTTLIIISMVLGFGNPSMVAYGYSQKSGVIVCPDNDPANARSGAGTNYSIDHRLANGKPVTVIDEVKGTDGNTWYKIKYNLIKDNSECTSYVRSDLVSITGTAQDTPGSSQTPGTSETPAGSIGTATCTGVNVYVRNNAGTSGTTKVTTINVGDVVNVHSQTTVSGSIWYQISLVQNGKTVTGWTIGDYLNVTYANTDTTGDFAASLRNQGFPESYIPNLVALHNIYPKWSFQAVKTGLDWNTVIATESQGARNLVHTSANDAMKSTLASEYNWNTNAWVVRDSSGWVSARSEYIAYVMDPRNHLDATNIFQFECLSFSSSQNLTGVQSILNGTFMSSSVKDADNSTLNYAQAFYDIGKELNVSPYHLASRVRQEQGVNGTSGMISGNYPGYVGYFNYFNVKASGVGSDTVIKNGLSYAKTQGWNTRYKSIRGGASLLASKYIGVGQDTLYFQKFNVVNKSNLYNHQYMQNVTAAWTEGKKIATTYSDKNQTFVFKIPVYNNMPSTACGFSLSGNPNNYIKSVSVTGGTLTPGFSGATTSYSMVVENSVSSVTVSASPVVSTSSISGTGTYKLSVGNNTITLNCKSQMGTTRTYTIVVARKEPSKVETADFKLSSSSYNLATTVTGISVGTTPSTMVSNISATGATVKVLNAQGTEKTTAVATGDKLAVYVNGTLKASYPVVIYGDLNGDGVVNIMDMIKLNRHILGASPLSDVYLQAADANRKGDGANIMDMIAINNHILGKKSIQQ